MCSIGDRNSSAVIQIEPWCTGLDILNAQCEILIGSIRIIIFSRNGDIGTAIIDHNSIPAVKGNACRQSITKGNHVLVIVIVSTVGVCGQGSGQLELELFVDCMVSAGTKTCFVGAILIVINFLLNSGLYNLTINWNDIGYLGNIQQEEGIVGMIVIARVKVGSINDQIIT